MRYLVFIAAIVAVLVASIGQAMISANRLSLGLLFFAVGIACFIFSYLKSSRRPLKPPAIKDSDRRKDALVSAVYIIILLVVALFYRGYRLEDYPDGFYYDEAVVGMEARFIIEGVDHPLFVEVTHTTKVIFWIISIVFRILGQSIFTLRFTTALFAAGAVIASYFLFRIYFSRELSFFAALLFALSKWNITVTRIGWPEFGQELLCYVLVILFIIKATRTGRWYYYLILGAVTSFGFYGHFGFRAALFIIFFYLSYLSIFKRGFLKAHFQGMLMLVFSFIILSSPYLVYIIKHPDQYTSRMRETQLFARTPPGQEWQEVKNSLRANLLMFHYRGDGNIRHNIPGDPMLNPVNRVLFLLGGSLLLVGLFKAETILMLLWFLGPLGQSIVTIEYPHATRTMGMTPLVYFLCALCLWHLYVVSSKVLGKRVLKPIAAVLLIAISTYNSWFSWDFYFNRYAHTPGVSQGFYKAFSEIGKFFKQLDNKYYVISRYRHHEEAIFISGALKDCRNLIIEEIPYEKPFSDKDLMFVFLAERYDLLYAIKLYYPNGIVHQGIDDKTKRPLFTAYEVKREHIIEAHGIKARYFSAKEQNGEITLETKEEFPAQALQNREKQPAYPPKSAHWQGSIKITQPGTYSFDMTGVEKGVVMVDGEVIFDSSRPCDERRYLKMGIGVYPLEIRANLAASSDNPPRLRMIPRGAKPLPVPPRAFYDIEIPGNTMAGDFRQGESFEGVPYSRRYLPNLSIDVWECRLCDSPCTIEFSGELELPMDGEYRFQFDFDGTLRLFIDDELVLSKQDYHHRRLVESQPREYKAGRHPYRLEIVAHDACKFYWILPHKVREIVPPTAFHR